MTGSPFIVAPSAAGRRLGAQLGGEFISPGASGILVLVFGPADGLRPLVSGQVKTEMPLGLFFFAPPPLATSRKTQDKELPLGAYLAIEPT